MDGGADDVTGALQQAYSGLIRAVELERRRGEEKLDTVAVVADLHELRTMMSAAAEMMRTFPRGPSGCRRLLIQGCVGDVRDTSVECQEHGSGFVGPHVVSRR